MFDKISEQLNAINGSLSFSKKISIFILLVGTIAGFLMIVTWAGSPDYQVLYSGLNSEDSGIILDYLKENNISYEISAYGNAISVPKENVHEVRMVLASKGLPQGSGVGFEIFDNTKIGMSEFAQNINYQRALQGELARTINRFDEVESSRVHIVMASKSLFHEQEESASASVVVKNYPGKTLSKKKVQSIVHLLSSSISGLEPENVTVVDSKGNMLARSNADKAFENSSDVHLDYQEKIERNLEHRVKSILETALGKAKANVRISCLIDFKKMEKTEEMYIPENRVIRSEQHFNELSGNEEEIPVGIPGPVDKNKANVSDAEMEKGIKNYQKNDQTINYEIGKVVSHIVEPTAKIKRLSVAVIVDGTYKENVDRKGNVSYEYIPRTRDEMQKLENIVKRTVNFDTNRGDEVEVVNIPFETTKNDFVKEEEPESGWLSKIAPYWYYMKYPFAALIILMIFLFVIRPIVTWLTSTTIQQRELINQLPKTVGEIENDTSFNTAQVTFQDKANQAFQNDQSSVDLLKQWLAQS